MKILEGEFRKKLYKDLVEAGYEKEEAQKIVGVKYFKALNSGITFDIEYFIDLNKLGGIITKKTTAKISILQGYNYQEIEKNTNLQTTLNYLDSQIYGFNLMKEIIKENKLPNFSSTTNNQGVVKFTNLDLGLYLIEQQNQIEGFSKIDPFLIYIPKVIDNKWSYDIKATPKVDIIRLFDF